MSETEATNPEGEDLEEVAEGTAAQGDDQTELNADSDEEQTEEELEEIEREGKKYRIPKALAPELMMQADYTRKTQEIAQTRQALDAEKLSLAQQAEASKALIAEHATVHALKQQVEAYKNVDWDTLEDQDPDAARKHWRAYERTKEALSTAEGDLSTKESKRLEAEQSQRDQALKETGAVLSRDIPGWGPELANKLVETAATYGVTLQELATETDPRVWKALHDAHQWRQHQAKQKTAQTIQKQAAVTPAVTTKGGSFSGAGVHDKLPTEEWMRRRNAELAKKRA